MKTAAEMRAINSDEATLKKMLEDAEQQQLNGYCTLSFHGYYIKDRGWINQRLTELGYKVVPDRYERIEYSTGSHAWNAGGYFSWAPEETEESSSEEK